MKRELVINYFDNIDRKWELISKTCKKQSYQCNIHLLVSGNLIDFNYAPNGEPVSKFYKSTTIIEFLDKYMMITEDFEDFENYTVIEYSSIDSIQARLFKEKIN